ncbi:alanine--glyoxylate aminotransferase family protein [Campylobacter sp. RM12327]|uniref:pyridoxal-phosphate-dependent aminotransferase family protein n=1 Tax=Campylobacter sputorum TaxID=206 RepID=UPI000B785556|nr:MULTISPECIES: aminotransferase class V-fold PLP-dependent enzyme [Campylobacter]ASM40702.1 aspartate aminotransferase [Campylobacter sputorum]MBE7357998.1 alanine--glyoxylate aminotransferase family protein [Campylobacter sp. RM11302]MBF6669598.1 alanine--glyoxylate aminotransferase family protein [Campylobacter sp. RM12327]MBF6674928.1 alanine--glyoxylate aminotransferase family protein [Campylobacter sp. RM13538]MBF6676911.1 alanine--glyoxylate aminotransferase family protein [Campylobact
MKKLLFTPGPVMMSKKVLKIGSNQPMYFRNDKFSKIILECKQLILKFVNAPKNSDLIFMTGSGTLGMEATLINLINNNEKATIINGGGFGERFIKICEKKNLQFSQIKLNLNEILDLNKIDTNSKALFTNAHETTIGRAYDLKAIGKFCEKNRMLFCVDAISAFMADEIDMTKQKIDALIISSNKGLALPPGLAIIILSKNAIENLVPCDSFYMDFVSYLNDIKRGQTPFTPPICIIYQLLVRLKEIDKKGVLYYNKKTHYLAKYFRNHIKDLPLKLYSKFPSNAMSAVEITNGEKAFDFINKFEKLYDITLTPSGGDLKDKLIRVGHLGNLSKKDMKFLIKCLKEYFKGIK